MCFSTSEGMNSRCIARQENNVVFDKYIFCSSSLVAYFTVCVPFSKAFNEMLPLREIATSVVISFIWKPLFFDADVVREAVFLISKLIFHSMCNANDALETYVIVERSCFLGTDRMLFLLLSEVDARMQYFLQVQS